MKTKLILLHLALLLSLNSFAGPRIFTTFVYASGGESLKELLTKKYKIPSSVLNEQGYLTKLSRWNRGLSADQKLAAGERIYLELPYSLKKQISDIEKAHRKAASKTANVNKKKNPIKKVKPKKLAKKKPIKKNLKQRKTENKRELASNKENIMERKEAVKKREQHDFSLSVFYAASQGTFDEKVKGSNISASTQQDSPATFGLSAILNSKEKFYYTTSFYISHLNTSSSDQLGEDVEIPLEYGSTFYSNYRVKDNISFYIGGDLERFSTFNIEEINNGEQLDTIEHNVLYFTTGLAYNYELFSFPMLTKLSVSQSLFSQSNAKNENENTFYNGNKFIFFSNIKILHSWSLNIFYKQHLLNGPTELNISRFGAGISYRFF